MNPKYKELKAIEMYRNTDSPHVSNDDAEYYGSLQHWMGI